MSLSSALHSAFLLRFGIKWVGGNSRTILSASIFSPSCDLDWNAVRARVIPSPQLWGPSEARRASVFRHFSSRSTAEKENGANRAFQSPVYLSPHLSTEEFYRNYAHRRTAVPSTLRAVPRLAPRGGMLRRRLLRSPGQRQS